jgi:hypothetical protein
LISNQEVQRDPDALRNIWQLLANEAKTGSEKIKIIRGIVNYTDDWVVSMLENYAKNDEDGVASLAESALRRVNDARSIRGQSK